MKRTTLLLPTLGLIVLCGFSSCTAVVETPAPTTTSTTVQRETVRTPAATTTTTTRSTGY